MLESLLNIVAGLQFETLFKKRFFFKYRFFPVNLTNFLKASFLQNTCTTASIFFRLSLSSFSLVYIKMFPGAIITRVLKTACTACFFCILLYTVF